MSRAKPGDARSEAAGSGDGTGKLRGAMRRLRPTGRRAASVYACSGACPVSRKGAFKLKISEKTVAVLSRLEKSGFEAYMVGGCVRDSILGRESNDTDIATNALPQQVMEVFCGYRVIPTGIKHGTVTVLLEDTPFEITTYRIDGSYSDRRRPDSVEFTDNITGDLSRRDFTINAAAMDLRGNIIDPFGGITDMKAGIICCVGEPAKRFAEDALRILRAVRFASQLGFRIEDGTAAAVRDMCGLLANISAERIRQELDKLLGGKDCARVLLEFSDVITAVVPEIKPCIGFDQHSPYHRYTVWEHTAQAVSSAPAEDLTLRRALFFHDIAKPVCAFFDKNGRGHFKGHDRVGADMTREIMQRLRYDNKTIDCTCALIANHSSRMETRYDVKKMMSGIGDELFFRLLEMIKFDNSAKNDFVLEEEKLLARLAAMGKGIIYNGECRTIGGLAVNGNDLSRLGFDGPEIGTLLRELLELVMSDRLPNDKERLLSYAAERIVKK